MKISYKLIGISVFGLCILFIFAAGCLVQEYGVGRDIMIFKVDAGGTEEWQTVIDTGGDDRAETIIQTGDGGYLVGGAVLPWRGDPSHGIFKVDRDGSLVWNATGQGDQITSVAETTGGTIVAVAMSGSRLLFYDQAGTPQGDEQGTERAGVLRSVLGTADGGFVVTGSAGGDAQVIKRDRNLAEEWQKTFGDDGDDEARDIVQTSDGGYLVSGITEMPERTDYGLWVLRLNATGDLLWKTTLARTDVHDVDFMDEAPGGGYTVIYRSPRTEEDGQYVRNLVDTTINSEGNVLKEQVIGAGRPVLKTPDGGYVSGNVTYQTISRYLVLQDQVGVPHIVKLRDDGSEEWDTALNTTFELIGDPVSVIQTADGGYALLVNRHDYPEVPE